MSVLLFSDYMNASNRQSGVDYSRSCEFEEAFNTTNKYWVLELVKRGYGIPPHRFDLFSKAIKMAESDEQFERDLATYGCPLTPGLRGTVAEWENKRRSARPPKAPIFLRTISQMAISRLTGDSSLVGSGNALPESSSNSSEAHIEFDEKESSG